MIAPTNACGHSFLPVLLKIHAKHAHYQLITTVITRYYANLSTQVHVHVRTCTYSYVMYMYVHLFHVAIQTETSKPNNSASTDRPTT